MPDLAVTQVLGTNTDPGSPSLWSLLLTLEPKDMAGRGRYGPSLCPHRQF